MCLAKLTAGTKRTTGYKVFIKTPRRLKSPLQKTLFKTNKWYKDESQGSLLVEGAPTTLIYPTGYHIYLTRKACESLIVKLKAPKKIKRWTWPFRLHSPYLDLEIVIKKVQFRNVVATGIDWTSFKTVVAKEMFIFN